MKKRFFAILLALIVCFSMSSTVFAIADTPTITETSGFNTEDDGWVLFDIPTITVGNDTVLPCSGTETWYGTGYSIKNVGEFTMEGSNLTPVKTIGTTISNSCLGIYADFESSELVTLTIQIRKAYTNTVLAEKKSGLTKSGSVVVKLLNVKKDDKVQIYFKVTDANGNYRDSLKCKVSYGYSLS